MKLCLLNTLTKNKLICERMKVLLRNALTTNEVVYRGLPVGFLLLRYSV